MTRPPAPALTAEEAAIVARFKAAPVPDEVMVENVARALEAACGDDATWLTLASAAIAALPPSPAEQAVKRVEALADQLDAEAEVRELRATTYPPSGQWAIDHNRLVVRADTFRRSARRIRAALASPAPAPQGERRPRCPGAGGPDHGYSR